MLTCRSRGRQEARCHYQRNRLPTAAYLRIDACYESPRMLNSASFIQETGDELIGLIKVQYLHTPLKLAASPMHTVPRRSTCCDIREYYDCQQNILFACISVLFHVAKQCSLHFFLILSGSGSSAKGSGAHLPHRKNNHSFLVLSGINKR